MLAIDISDVKKSYFGKAVLSDVSLKLEAGRFYALIGQNGSGKSTLMRILMRLEAPDNGDGVVAGFRLSEDRPDFFRKVGYASEAINYNSWLTIEKFFAALGQLYPAWDPDFFKAIVSELGLDITSKFATLSRGQRIQISMAFAFAIHPQVLLFDEVTAVLDPRARSYLLRLCKDFVAAGGTILMATNIVSEIHGIADTLVYLESTKKRLVSEVAALSNSFVRLRKRVGADHPIFQNRDCHELRVSDDDTVLCLIPSASVREPIPTELIYPGKVTAEDIFIYYTYLAARGVA